MTEIAVRFDRVGSVYHAGETITGVVVVKSESAQSHNGIKLEVTGAITCHPSVRGFASFETIGPQVKPVSLISLSIPLAPKGDKLPAGSVELPFSFPLAPTAGADGSLVETYNGVYVSSAYSALATIQFTFSKAASPPQPILVICRGQSLHLLEAAHAEDKTLHSFSLNETMILNTSRKASAPQFLINGAVSLINDIDVPLSGWVTIERCSKAITSLELQFIRVESAAVKEGSAKEATEIQNIQLGEGDVTRGVKIPLYMFFPRWFTCPTIRTTTIRVDFECNLVCTFEDHTQITHNFPLFLYRASA